ncbi:Carboxylesterase, type B [Akanthomyces lecanii RCEF 1005]|uniref:Carboxylic ester hydrolase n=1 Tax=Akanthomyces lecanii RCEF 1005 TaxID=1081108 RepID=A0A168G0E1_CORDF|nr:Carboxylesterase, type B [Akanthomyces lecanii RCEF 1005]
MKLSLVFVLTLTLQDALAASVQAHIRDSTASNATQYAMPWLASFSNNNNNNNNKLSFSHATVDMNGAELTGRSILGVETFSGIPYAAPPIGQLRFRPPQDFSGFADKFDATRLAPACPQVFVAADAKGAILKVLDSFLELPLPILADITNGQEDCLTVTIHRPAGTKPGDKLPVLFWMYGGAFQLGSSNTYDGSSLVTESKLAGTPVIIVAINYRVAGFGFLGGKEILADGSANVGSLDQRKALEWVADNIAYFGGDPDRVTIWGESAGAFSVFNQLIMYNGNATYKGKSLIAGGIMNSGSVLPMEPVDSRYPQAIYDDIVIRAGCTGALDTLSCLRQAPYDKVLTAIRAQGGILSFNDATIPWWPRPDGTVFPYSPEVALSKGLFHKAPVINGMQEDEGALFGLVLPDIDTTKKIVDFFSSNIFRTAPRELVQQLANQFSEDPAEGCPYRTGPLNQLHAQSKRVSSLFGEMLIGTQRRVTLQALRKVAPDVPAWSYISSYYHLIPYLGTCHATDIVQTFYGLPIDDASLATRQYYFNFVTNQDPNKGHTMSVKWPQWDGGNSIMQFDTLSHSVIKDDFRTHLSDYLSSEWGSFKL